MDFGKTSSYGIQMCGLISMGSESTTVVYGSRSLDLGSIDPRTTFFLKLFIIDFIKICYWNLRILANVLILDFAPAVAGNWANEIDSVQIFIYSKVYVTFDTLGK